MYEKQQNDACRKSLHRKSASIAGTKKLGILQDDDEKKVIGIWRYQKKIY